MSLMWLNQTTSIIHKPSQQQAQKHQNSLTKPPGSLGRLEDIAIRLCGMQSTEAPRLDQVQITVFAADHGVADEGVSAFPQAVTVEMVRNFARGGAAISVMAKQLGAQLEVVNVGTVSEHEALDGVLAEPVAAGTANFCQQPAMSPGQLLDALDVGRRAVDRAMDNGAQLFIGGDMGIANTTSATAMACALLGQAPENLTGPGTGLDAKGIKHKTRVIADSLQQHSEQLQSPLDILQCLGGFEIAALSGAYIACAQQGLSILVDGYIASVAALTAMRINPRVKDWMFFSHASAEPGHQTVMQAIGAEPLIDFNMRLGEGSGAAVVVPLMRMACALHNSMATFEQAGVTNK